MPGKAVTGPLPGAESSRRNGSRSSGPRTPAGKAVSAKNALKHGLFKTPVLVSALPASPELAGALAGMSMDLLETGETEAAQLADWRLAQATHLLAELDARISKLAAAEESDAGKLVSLIAERTRIGRYQRRFRGTRDRALRALIKLNCVPADAA